MIDAKLLTCFTVKADREGGAPIEMSAQGLGINGFTSKREWGGSKFIAPCVYYAFPEVVADESSVPEGNNGSVSPALNKTVKEQQA